MQKFISPFGYIAIAALLYFLGIYFITPYFITSNGWIVQYPALIFLIALLLGAKGIAGVIKLFISDKKLSPAAAILILIIAILIIFYYISSPHLPFIK